jgi:hypothetical protein
LLILYGGKECKDYISQEKQVDYEVQNETEIRGCDVEANFDWNVDGCVNKEGHNNKVPALLIDVGWKNYEVCLTFDPFINFVNT